MSRVRSVAFAPDGRMLAAASREGVFFWDLANLSVTSEALAIGSTAESDRGDGKVARRTVRAGPSNRSTPGDQVLWIWDCLMRTLCSRIGFAMVAGHVVHE